MLFQRPLPLLSSSPVSHCDLPIPSVYSKQASLACIWENKIFPFISLISSIWLLPPPEASFYLYSGITLHTSLNRLLKHKTLLSAGGGAFSMAQTLRICLQCRRPSAMQETKVWSWVGKIPWRREWPPTPVFLPGEFHRQRSLVGYSPWGCKESDTTERLTLSAGGEEVRIA